MVKFCQHCGTQLEEGQVCTCPQAQAEAAQPQDTPLQQPVQPQQPQYMPPSPPQYTPYQQPRYAPPPQQAPSAPRVPSPVGSAFRNIIPFFKTYLHSPVHATRTAIAQNDLLLAAVLLAIQAVAVGLMIFASLSKVCGMVKWLAFAMGYSGASLFGGPSIAPSFLMCLIFGILAAAIAIAIFAALIFVVAKIMKSACSFRDVLIACGANSPFVTVLLLLAVILFFLSLQLGAIFFAAAMLAWVALGVHTAQAVSPNAELGKFWISYIAAVLAAMLVGGWIGGKFFCMSVDAVRISDYGGSYTVGEVVKQAGGINGIMKELMDQNFF